jgi:hypothetical protein
MLTIQSARNPVYVVEDGSRIDLLVMFEEFPNEEMPFTAAPNDPMPYGVELYNRAQAGDFGPVAPYVAPQEPNNEQPTSQGAQTL